MSHQLPATYNQFFESVFAKNRSQIRDLSFVNDIAHQFTRVGECAFGAVGQCSCCGKAILNVEPFVEEATDRYGLNEAQRDNLRTRLTDDGELNPTEDGICRSCH